MFYFLPFVVSRVDCWSYIHQNFSHIKQLFLVCTICMYKCAKRTKIRRIVLMFSRNSQQKKKIKIKIVWILNELFIFKKKKNVHCIKKSVRSFPYFGHVYWCLIWLSMKIDEFAIALHISANINWKKRKNKTEKKKQK